MSNHKRKQLSLLNEAISPTNLHVCSTDNKNENNKSKTYIRKIIRKVNRILKYPTRALKAANKPILLWPVILIDMLIERKKSGCAPSQYVDYSFILKSETERATYFLNNDNVNFIEAINGSAVLDGGSSLNILRDKKILLERMGKSLQRDYIVLDDCSDDEFMGFVAKHQKFIAKPRTLAGGQDIQVFNVRDKSYDLVALKQMLIKNNITLLEEFIVQHETINKIYPYAVNTIRVHTLRTGNQVDIVLDSFIRFGLNQLEINSDADYAVFVKINHETGMLYDYGIYLMEQHYEHADTKFKFKGFRVPFFEEVKTLAIELAHKIPELNFIGWDIAITPTGPVVVEGNGGPASYHDCQSYALFEHGTGSKDTYSELLDYYHTRMSLTETRIEEINAELFVEFGDQSIEPDVVMILGSKYCRYRIEAAYERFSKSDCTYFIVSGGNPCLEQFEDEKRSDYTEAQYMQQFLLKRGIEEAFIVIENESTHTRENIENSLKLIKDLKLDNVETTTIKIAIVTGGFHMKRVSEMIKPYSESQKYEFISVPAYGEHTGKGNWYKNQLGIKIIMKELAN